MHVHACPCTFVCVCVHAQVHTCVYVCVCVRVCMHVHLHVCIYMCVYMCHVFQTGLKEKSRISEWIVQHACLCTYVHVLYMTVLKRYNIPRCFSINFVFNLIALLICLPVLNLTLIYYIDLYFL